MAPPFRRIDSNRAGKFQPFGFHGVRSNPFCVGAGDCTPREIEAEIEKQPLPSNVKSDEFKELAFAKTEDELATRCLRVKALQTEIAERLNEENRDIFLQRIQKRRLNQGSGMARQFR